MTNFEMVDEFMTAGEQEVKKVHHWPDNDTVLLRRDLIQEELSELSEAIFDRDITAVADALTDILYVTYGAGHAFGIDLDKCFAEVQRSNMSKFGPNGEVYKNDSGKVMKGPNYTEPDLSPYVQPLVDTTDCV
jgi:predicted HAD superfamily Cof-like phosphohydrolase